MLDQETRNELFINQQSMEFFVREHETNFPQSAYPEWDPHFPALSVGLVSEHNMIQSTNGLLLSPAAVRLVSKIGFPSALPQLTLIHSSLLKSDPLALPMTFQGNIATPHGLWAVRRVTKLHHRDLADKLREATWWFNELLALWGRWNFSENVWEERLADDVRWGRFAEGLLSGRIGDGVGGGEGGGEVDVSLLADTDRLLALPQTQALTFNLSSPQWDLGRLVRNNVSSLTGRKNNGRRCVAVYFSGACAATDVAVMPRRMPRRMYTGARSHFMHGHSCTQVPPLHPRTGLHYIHGQKYIINRPAQVFTTSTGRTTSD